MVVARDRERGQGEIGEGSQKVKKIIFKSNPTDISSIRTKMNKCEETDVLRVK